MSSAAERALTGDPVLDRRSIRKYTDEPVDDATVERLLRAAMSAPSAGNQQPWAFVVVRDESSRRRIAQMDRYVAMASGAAVVILVCCDMNSSKMPDIWVQDCSAATENILVEAQALGLGAVWLGVHLLPEREREVRALFGLPPEIVPFALVALGHPAETKAPSKRFRPERVHYDRW